MAEKTLVPCFFCESEPIESFIDFLGTFIFWERRLEGRFKWLLGELCRRAEIDVQEIDSSLEYWEAKEEIEKRFHVELRLK